MQIKKWIINWFDKNTNSTKNEIENGITENYFDKGWIDSFQFISCLSDTMQLFGLSSSLAIRCNCLVYIQFERSNSIFQYVFRSCEKCICCICSLVELFNVINLFFFSKSDPVQLSGRIMQIDVMLRLCIYYFHAIPFNSFSLV